LGVVPLVLVLSAATAHAGWNLIAKRASGGLGFVWLCAPTDVAVYAVPAAIQAVFRTGDLSWSGVGFMVGSGLLHTGYFNSLQRGYAEGDLSLVYPLARGTGPLLSVIAAIAILGQRASAPALAGAGLIVASIFSLTRGARRSGSGKAIALAMLTGAFTAAYTVWDAHAVTTLHQPVIVYFWGVEVVRTLALAPWALRHPRHELHTIWSANKRGILGFALLAPVAYILVLVALTKASVIFVAPAREVSIVFGVLLGANVLGEGRVLQRALAGVGILAGIVLLAVA
jgi:drug/metabolite transporter (DMT)-like permease